jgi:hypothetical protein
MKMLMQLKILFSMLKILYHKIRGSKGGSHNLQSTEGKSQLGRSGFKIGFELKIPFELHALSVKDGNLRYERHGIRLLPNLQFLNKTQHLNNPWIHPNLYVLN